MSGLRVKAAKSVSKVELPEIYLLNRFLHTNKERQIQIEEIISYLPDPPLENLDLEPSSIGQIIYFTDGISKSNISYFTFVSPKILMRFFEFGQTETSPHEWERLKVKYYDLAEKLLYSNEESTSFKDDIYPPVKILSLKSAPLNSHVEEINLWNEEPVVKEIKTIFQIPETINYISKFIPVIQKISLLNSNDFLNETFVLENKKFGLDVNLNLPQIKKLNTLQITNDYPMMDYQNLSLSTCNTYRFENEVLEIPAKNLDNLLSNHNHDLEKLLEPVFELSEDVISEVLFSIPEFQKTGAKFLFHSPFGLLCDSFDLGKELQATAAIKLLLRLRAVRKVLIITSRFQEMNFKCNGDSEYKNIWEANTSLLLNGFSTKFYSDSDEIFGDEEFQNNFIHGINYDNLEESFIKGTLPYEKLRSFDCVIFDDLIEDHFGLDSIKLITKNIKPNFFWILSERTISSVKNKVQNIYPRIELNTLERNKISVGINSGGRLNYDYFLTPNENQIDELSKIYDEGRKKLDDLVQFGNLLRIQPNAFQIMQEIQKKGNFDCESKTGIKVDILKDHIQKILSHEDRLLIYSQFESSGLIEIKEIINELGIDYISFRQMDSIKDLDEKIKLSNNFDGKLIYLTNLKPNGIKFKFPKVSYLINYDNWWSPPTRWSLEEKLETNGKALTVINYYLSSTAESNLYFDLKKKGLLDKNIIDSIQPEKFYQIYDDKCWGNFFELSYDIFKTNSNGSFETPNMVELVNKSKLFLRGLGCYALTSQASINSNIYNLSGTLKSSDGEKIITAKCIYSNHLNSDFLKSVIFNMELKDNKIFIITNGKVSHSNYILPENVSLIDGDQLKTYLNLFRISA